MSERSCAGFHEVEIEIRPDGEEIEHLVLHLAILGSDTDSRIKSGVGGKVFDHGGHLDSFRAGAKTLSIFIRFQNVS